MHRRFLIKLFILFALILTASTLSAAEPANKAAPRAVKQAPTANLAADAVSPDAAIAGAARVSLRAAGPAGLASLLETHAEGVARLERELLSGDALSAEMTRLREAIDAVAAQRDAYSSGLYWYTDLAQAKAAAATSGKPILSLRLLGQLDEEWSCANSRFFRTVLYADPKIAGAMSENFILHWSSERPVPVATIDYGDGRVIKRTITGNSIHYVLDAEGRVLDALPGLYAPADFEELLTSAKGLHEIATTSALADAGAPPTFGMMPREVMLREWHVQRFNALKTQWQAELAAVGAALPEDAFAGPPEIKSEPAALRAAPRAIGKSRVEVDIVRALDPKKDLADSWALSEATDAEAWDAIATRALERTTLSAESVQHMRVKHRRLGAPDRVLSDAELAPVVERFLRALAEDTTQNRYQLYLQTQRWLAESGEVRPDMATFNARIYAELFLTPSQDPWLGLAPDEVYSGVEGQP